MPLTLTRVVSTALLAGVIAGLFFFAVQSFTTRPLIVQAEEHESTVSNALPEGSGYVHSWTPRDGLERAAYTAMADILIAVGYAFLLVGAISMSGSDITPVKGLLWGLAGFLVFVVAPSLGLPAEPPNSPAAGLASRQIWWIATACSTAVGLWLVVMPPHKWWIPVGAALLVLPHMIGAPKPPNAGAEAHSELVHQFRWASLIANAVLWAALGFFVGLLLHWFRHRSVSE